MKVKKCPTLATHNSQLTTRRASNNKRVYDPTMSSNDANDRKRKQTIIPEIVTSNDGRNPKEGRKKARRVSKNVTELTTASLPLDTSEVTAKATTATTAAAAPKQDVSIERIGALIRIMFHSDNVRVNAALNTLFLDLNEDEKKKKALSQSEVAMLLFNYWINA
jgi:hypothetical protein